MGHLRNLLQVAKTFKNWPTQILDYLNLLPPKKIVYRLRNGAKFNARAKTFDGMAIREVWVLNDYTPKGFEINRDAIVLEVGGHIGSFAVLASRCATAGKVFVFEPSPENFAMLQENIRLNSATNVTTFNLALLGHAGSREISLSPNMVSNSIVVDLPGAKKVEIQGISLSDFIKQQNIERIDFMKLDCEGAEYEILFESPDDALRRIKKIAAEIHDLDDKRNRVMLGKFLESKGFEVTLDPVKTQMLYAKAKGGK